MRATDSIPDTRRRDSPPPTCRRGRVPIGAVLTFLLGASVCVPGAAQQDGPDPVHVPVHSVAREWNELLLYAIRRDFARPTVHARNLFHVSAAMYDAWAVYDDVAAPYFLGRTQANGERCEFDAATRALLRDLPDEAAREESRRDAISFAAYRLIRRRFARSPGGTEVRARSDELFTALGLDASVDSTDVIATPTPAVLGNLIADCLRAQGAADGANAGNDFANRYYTPLNAPLEPGLAGNPGLSDPNRWQPLQLDIFIDQSGNQTGTPFFLGAEWGEVLPFALTPEDVTRVERDGQTYPAYLDPGPPALLGDDPVRNADYLNGHALVALWSAHLDPADGVLWDISPGTLGNGGLPPATSDDPAAFYRALEGGTSGDRGHAVNPATGHPYAPQIVPRGDYTRVLAEFWADGPDSETPPGHWFRVYNEAVADHPDFVPRFAGENPPLDALEFDVKTYFLLGGALHDSAIAAWSIKGAYDYVRPVSAIRYMSDQGQSGDPEAPRYSVQGSPLVPGRIELIGADDPLAGNGGANVGKVKVLAWRGPSLIVDPDTDTAGVGWIPMERWVPYQRPTFVTPPFAGYVSGHSTFSRAAAEVLTRVTGDAFFPGGLAEFTAPRDEFLVFEDGPSVDVVLQWATYRDASDQTSLSRIWGGIHPPVDDIPGRRIGIEIAGRSWTRAGTFFDGTAAGSDEPTAAGGGGGDGGSAGSSGCSIASRPGAADPLLVALLLTALAALTLRGEGRTGLARHVPFRSGTNVGRDGERSADPVTTPTG